MEGAKHFLTQLIGASADIDTEADAPNPDLAEVEFDHEAMVEAMAEMSRDEDDAR